MQRSAPEVVFCFDGDRAGREAAWRAAENALPMLGGNHQLKFMFLPDGEDPDTLVKQQGPEAFNGLVEQAKSYSDFFFESLESRVDMNSMDGRARLVEVARPYLRHIPAGVYREMFEQRLAERAQTSTSVLHKHLEKAPATQNKVKKAAPVSTGISPIRMAITILLQHPELHASVGEFDKISALSRAGVPVLIELLETLYQQPHLNTAALLERARETEHGEHLKKLAIQTLDLSPEALQHELVGVVEQLQEEALELRHEFLMAKGLSKLTEQERQEIQQLASRMKR